MSPYHTPILQELLDLPYENPFPVWPACKPVKPLLYLGQVETEYLLPESPEEWSSATVIDELSSALYIFAEGQWWQYPKVVMTESWDYYGTNREYTSLPLHILSVKVKELEEALRGIIEIGKRDTTNPKYDHYYDCAREVLEKYKS